MKTAQDIILKPVITEKSFKVKVAKVNTIHMRGQKRRMGRNEGYTPSWKKAIVTLTPDSKGIPFFESMM